MSNNRYEEIKGELNQIKLDGFERLVEKAFVKRNEYLEILEKAKQENDHNKANYLRGVIDGLNILLASKEE